MSQMQPVPPPVPTSSSNQPALYAQWVGIILFCVVAIVGIWAAFAQINTILSSFTTLLAIISVLLQIKFSALKTAFGQKAIGIRVLILLVLVASIAINIIQFATNSANARNITPIALAHTSNTYPTSTPPATSPTPALVGDGTKTFNLALNCPSSPLSFTVVESTIKNHVTTLAIAVYNPSNNMHKSVK